MKNKNTVTRLIILFLASMISSTTIVFGTEVTESITCMNVDSSGIATGISTDFLSSTPYIYVRATFSNLQPDQVITFEWEIPGGGSWDFTEITASSEIVYWNRIPIEGDLAANYKGTWTINIYVDNELVDIHNFKIVDYNDLLGDIQSLIEQIQAANTRREIQENQMAALNATIIELTEDYSAVLAQNLLIQNELNQKILEFTTMQSNYNELNLNYTQNIQELEDVQEQYEALKNQSGDNTTLYLAIGAALIAILAAAYFYMKSR